MVGGGLRELVWGWDGDGWKKESVITLHRHRERERSWGPAGWVGEVGGSQVESHTHSRPNPGKSAVRGAVILLSVTLGFRAPPAQ